MVLKCYKSVIQYFSPYREKELMIMMIMMMIMMTTTDDDDEGDGDTTNLNQKWNLVAVEFDCTVKFNFDFWLHFTG